MCNISLSNVMREIGTMNIEQAKELVGTGKIVVVDELATMHLPFMNYKFWCTIEKQAGDVFTLKDYFTNNNLGWFTANTFNLLEYEYIDDYKKAVTEAYNGKHVQVLKMSGHWEELTYYTLQELKGCNFRIKYN